MVKALSRGIQDIVQVRGFSGLTLERSGLLADLDEFTVAAGSHAPPRMRPMIPSQLSENGPYSDRALYQSFDF